MTEQFVWAAQTFLNDTHWYRMLTVVLVEVLVVVTGGKVALAPSHVTPIGAFAAVATM